jgi:hypothetical protein
MSLSVQKTAKRITDQHLSPKRKLEGMGRFLRGTLPPGKEKLLPNSPLFFSAANDFSAGRVPAFWKRCRLKEESKLNPTSSLAGRIRPLFRQREIPS